MSVQSRIESGERKAGETRFDNSHTHVENVLTSRAVFARLGV